MRSWIFLELGPLPAKVLLGDNLRRYIEDGLGGVACEKKVTRSMLAICCCNPVDTSLELAGREPLEQVSGAIQSSVNLRC